MSEPSEPLLPPEAPPPSHGRLWLAMLGAALLGAGILAAVLLARPSAPAPTRENDAPPADVPPARSGPLPRDEARPKTSSDTAEEKQARALYEAAEAFERSDPADYEKRIARWRELMTKFPTSPWARKADEKHRAASAALQAFLDREFDGVRRDSQALAAAGHFQDAIEAIQSYRDAQSRDLLKRRAEVEIAVLENQSRLAYNEASQKAKGLAEKRDYAGAAALLEAVSREGIPEVASRCRAALAQIKTASEEFVRYEESRKGDEARRALREDLGPKLLARVRARQYDDAMKDLSAAAAAAPNASLKEELSAERAAVADASSFWEAFLKTLRAKTGQDASILLADGKRLSGKIARLQADRVVIEGSEGSLEAPFDRLHADQLVGWTIGRSLPAEDPVTYLKAALFFFCDGRDDLARLYLATARELNGSIDAAEKVFRGGLLRAAMSAKK